MRTYNGDPTLRRERLPLFDKSPFRSAAGLHLDWKVECDRMPDDDIIHIARICAPLLPPYGSVVGVPRGGNRIAAEFARFVTDVPRTLVVDDVWTTGQSWFETVMGRGLDIKRCIGFVIFSRAFDPPPGIYAMWKPGFAELSVAGRR